MSVLVWNESAAAPISVDEINRRAAGKAGGFRYKPFLKPPGDREYLEREKMEYEKGNSALE